MNNFAIFYMIYCLVINNLVIIGWKKNAQRNENGKKRCGINKDEGNRISVPGFFTFTFFTFPFGHQTGNGIPSLPVLKRDRERDEWQATPEPSTLCLKWHPAFVYSSVLVHYGCSLSPRLCNALWEMECSPLYILVLEYLAECHILFHHLIWKIREETYCLFSDLCMPYRCLTHTHHK